MSRNRHWFLTHARIYCFPLTSNNYDTTSIVGIHTYISRDICCRLKSYYVKMARCFQQRSISETIPAAIERAKRGLWKIELKTFDRLRRASDPRKTTWSFYSWQSISSRLKRIPRVSHTVVFRFGRIIEKTRNVHRWCTRWKFNRESIDQIEVRQSSWDFSQPIISIVKCEVCFTKYPPVKITRVLFSFGKYLVQKDCIDCITRLH